MNRDQEIALMVHKARREGRLGYQCEHLDFGACFNCRAGRRIKTPDSGAISPFIGLKYLKDPNGPNGMLAEFPKMVFHGAR